LQPTARVAAAATANDDAAPASTRETPGAHSSVARRGRGCGAV